VRLTHSTCCISTLFPCMHAWTRRQWLAGSLSEHAWWDARSSDCLLLVVGCCANFKREKRLESHHDASLYRAMRTIRRTPNCCCWMSSRASWRLSIYLLSYPMHSLHGTAFQTITTFAPRQHTSTSAWVSHTYLTITATSNVRRHHYPLHTHEHTKPPLFMMKQNSNTNHQHIVVVWKWWNNDDNMKHPRSTSRPTQEHKQLMWGVSQSVSQSRGTRWMVDRRRHVESRDSVYANWRCNPLRGRDYLFLV
jgi:hypothetical protein